MNNRISVPGTVKIMMVVYEIAEVGTTLPWAGTDSYIHSTTTY